MTRTERTGRGWAYTGALLGALVSIAANVAHSYVPPAGSASNWHPQAGAVIGAVFWPVALAVAVEILARTWWPAGWQWKALRLGGLLPVALVAAVVSYRHLSALLAFYGEDRLTATIGPLAVDGLMVMATGALLASGTRATAAVQSVTTPHAEPVGATPAEPVPVPALSPALRLPASMRTAIDDTARQVADEGRNLTVADIRKAVRIPEDMAARIVADYGHVNGTAVTG